jgi:hypothetical protein
MRVLAIQQRISGCRHSFAKRHSFSRHYQALGQPDQGPGQRGLQDRSGEWRTAGSCPVKFLVEDPWQSPRGCRRCGAGSLTPGTATKGAGLSAARDAAPAGCAERPGVVAGVG